MPHPVRLFDGYRLHRVFVAGTSQGIAKLAWHPVARETSATFLPLPLGDTIRRPAQVQQPDDLWSDVVAGPLTCRYRLAARAADSWQRFEAGGKWHDGADGRPRP